MERRFNFPGARLGMKTKDTIPGICCNRQEKARSTQPLVVKLCFCESTKTSNRLFCAKHVFMKHACEGCCHPNCGQNIVYERHRVNHPRPENWRQKDGIALGRTSRIRTATTVVTLCAGGGSGGVGVMGGGGEGGDKGRRSC